MSEPKEKYYFLPIDFNPRTEEPYSVVITDCLLCKLYASACYTERFYTGDYEFKKGSRSYNSGTRCPATECCHGPVCFSCAASFSNTEVFCNLCRKNTEIVFLNKGGSNYFSEETRSNQIGDWIGKLWDFDNVLESLGENRHFFISWLRNNPRPRELEFYPNSYDIFWHYLDLDNRITKVLIREFLAMFKFLVSQFVLLRTNFFNRFQVFGHILMRNRKKIRPVFIDPSLKHLVFPKLSNKKKLLQQFHIGFIGTLSVRLSQFQRGNPCNLTCLFDQFALNWILNNFFPK
jgi:hypothetical protein